MVEILEIEGIDAVAEARCVNRADFVFFLEVFCRLIYAVNFGAAADFEAPMIVQMRALQGIARLHRDDMKFGAAANEQRRLALAYAFEPQKLFVEFARLVEVIGFHRAMRKHCCLHDGFFVVCFEYRILDRCRVIHRASPWRWK